MKKIKIISLILIISLSVFSETKKDRYNKYVILCNTVITDTILQSGYVKYDTIRVKTVPKIKTYYKKVIVKSIQIKVGVANIIVADTIWNTIKAPTYRDASLYYSKRKIPISKPIIEVNLKNKQICFRKQVYEMKKEKPLSYTDWAKINN